MDQMGLNAKRRAQLAPALWPFEPEPDNDQEENGAAAGEEASASETTSGKDAPSLAETLRLSRKLGRNGAIIIATIELNKPPKAW